MSIYELFQTDKSLEQEGFDLDFGDFKIRVARSGGSNNKYKKLLEARMKPHRYAIEHDNLADSVARQLLAEVFAETVVLGWENVTDRDGNEIEFTKENVVNLLIELPDLFDYIREASSRYDLYIRRAQDDLAKNSKRGSGGKKSGEPTEKSSRTSSQE